MGLTSEKLPSEERGEKNRLDIKDRVKLDVTPRDKDVRKH